jgi:DNA-binding PadR family transcriptional regulator
MNLRRHFHPRPHRRRWGAPQCRVLMTAVESCALHTRYAYLVSMTIRYGLLALLQREPMYGYQLRTEFERATGGTWPLNIGQVYTTLTRLERDDLIESHGEDEEGRSRYSITAVGEEALASWFSDPVTSSDRPRDELAIKLALAVTVPGVDVRAVCQRQRQATITHLQSLTRLKHDSPGDDLSWSLVVEALRFQAEAEVRWLDHCEATLARAAASRTDTAAEADSASDGRSRTSRGAAR